MGLTQHAHGVDTIRALLNVGPGARSRGPTASRAHADPRPFGRAGRGRGRLCAGHRRRDARSVVCAVGRSHTGRARAVRRRHDRRRARGDTDVFWMVGGNFLETVADPARTREALWRPRLRVHHDIVLSSSMLVDPSDTVLVLPATTRYETPGGGTETSTERRIIFSPEIEGRRIGSARPEWWALGPVIARVRPAAAGQFEYADAGAIRAEIARAIPLYAGIETLQRAGDQVQWGGRRLFEAGSSRPPTDVRTDRRGTAADAASNQARSSCPHDAASSSTPWCSGTPTRSRGRRATPCSSARTMRRRLARWTAHTCVSSATGTFEGQAFIAPIHPGNLEVHWPEALLAARCRARRSRVRRARLQRRRPAPGHRRAESDQLRPSPSPCH